jgi:DIS3-like exonuclease 2
VERHGGASSTVTPPRHGAASTSTPGHHHRRNRTHDREANPGTYEYLDHYSDEQIKSGLDKGKIFLGLLRVPAKKRKIAYITVPNIGIDIVIKDENARNRAHHGSDVYVEILPETEWPEIMDFKEEEEDGGARLHHATGAADADPAIWNVRRDLLDKDLPDDALSGPKEMHRLEIRARALNCQPAGKVVGIAKMTSKISLIGSLKAQCSINRGVPLPDAVSVFFLPMDKRYCDMIIPRTELPDAFVSDPFTMQSGIYYADIDPEWSDDSKSPFGMNVRHIGQAGNIQAEIEALLTENGLNHPPFSDDVLKGGVLEGVSAGSGWEIPAEEIAKRRDLRSTRIFTIDPYSARDLDDALHITELPNGTFEIGVHIADVTYFLREGTVLDDEAVHRATSIYLVPKVIPMLPPILCEELCSLNPNTDRLAYSCIWNMNADGTLCDNKPWIGRTVIRSCSKLDYATAQRMVDGLIPSKKPADLAELDNIPDDVWELARRPEPGFQTMWDIANDVCMLHRVAMGRRKLRFENGAISLNKSKITFTRDPTGNPIDIGTYVMRSTNEVVEEYMLLANYFVAQELVARSKTTAFLRNHPPPDITPKNIADFLSLAEKFDVDVDLSTPRSLQRTLNDIRSRADRDASLAAESLLMKVMKNAEYFVVGTSHSSTWAHYALAIPYYTHFTSPIRRYADDIVHRLLTDALSEEQTGARDAVLGTKMDLSELVKLAGHCNMRKKSAKDAEERCDRVYMAIYLKQNPLVETAIVIGMGKKSFTLLVSRFGIESRMFVDDMHGVESHYNEREGALTLKYKQTSQYLKTFEDVADIADHIMKFNQLRIEQLTKVKVYLSPRNSAPLDIRVHLVGPA